MAIYIGNNSLSAAKLGTTNISSIWLGDVKLWPTIVYYKFQAEYSDGTTYDVECDGSGTLGTNQTKPSGYEYSAMTTAIIGDCVDYMSYSTFGQCYSLSSVTLPNSLKTIGDNAFDSCSGLTSITIPNSVSSITSYAFTKCSGLTNVVVPNSVTNLGTGVFQRCSELQSATLPSGLTSIQSNLFRYCSSLSSVTIPSSVITIGGYAFAETKITDITIPNGVTSIGNSAFNLCRSLTSVTVEATTPPILGTNVFYSTNNCPIYVPCDSVNAYRSASGWSTYASRIQPIPNSCVSCNWEIMSEGDEIPSNYVKGIRIPFGMIAPEGAYIGFEDEDGNIIEVAYDINDDSWFMQYPSGSEQLVFDGDYAEVNFSDYGVGDATVTNSSIPFECILCIVP